MESPVVIIGDKGFSPQPMGRLERIKKGVLEVGMRLAGDLLYEDNRQLREVNEVLHLALYYGQEAADCLQQVIHDTRGPILSGTELMAFDTCHHLGAAAAYRRQLMRNAQAVYKSYFGENS